MQHDWFPAEAWTGMRTVEGANCGSLIRRLDARRRGWGVMILRCEAHGYGKEASFRQVIFAAAYQEDGMGDCCEKAGWIHSEVASLPT